MMLGDDVDVAEAAAEAADQRLAEAEQAVGDGAGAHEAGGDDEQRHRQENEAVEQAVEALLGDEADILAFDRSR